MSFSFNSIVRLSARRQFRRFAFTLTELLVVIATVAILAVTLLPALARSQAKTQLTQCLNNLHQFGLAIQMYGNDNQDYLPFPNWGVNGATGNTTGWLYKPIGGNPPPIANNPVLTYQNGLLWRYLQNINTYWCPVDASTTNQPYRIGSGSTYSQRADKMSTYVMNGAACDFNGKYPAYKITDVTQKQAVILWEPNDRNADGSYNPGAYNDGANEPDLIEGPGLLHNLGSDLLYLDGHVTFMLHTTALSLMKTNVANEFWWNPAYPDGH